MKELTPAQWEFLATLNEDWQLCGTVKDSIVVGLEVRGYIETGIGKQEVPGMAYKPSARITAAGVVALYAHAEVAA